MLPLNPLYRKKDVLALKGGLALRRFCGEKTKQNKELVIYI